MKEKEKKKRWKKPFFAGALAFSLIAAVPLPGGIAKANAASPSATFLYIVQPKDTLWSLSRKFGTTVAAIKEANHLQSDMIYIGQALQIPASNNPLANESLSNGSPARNVSSAHIPQSNEGSGPWVEYITHIVQRGETGWTIALKYGIPFSELLKVNHLTESSVLMPGDRLTIPIHHVPVKPTAGPIYGEYLDWWTEAQYVWPIGTVATVTDFQTGISWKMKRVSGAFHADVEPLTAADTEIMKKVWGGKWSWATRPVLVSVNGHRIAASASAMPHSIDFIKENNFPGHSDIHFANSRRHKDNQVDPAHQKSINIAAGRK